MHSTHKIESSYEYNWGHNSPQQESSLNMSYGIKINHCLNLPTEKFGFFLTIYPLRLHFLWYESLQKVKFF